MEFKRCKEAGLSVVMSAPESPRIYASEVEAMLERDEWRHGALEYEKKIAGLMIERDKYKAALERACYRLAREALNK